MNSQRILSKEVTFDGEVYAICINESFRGFTASFRGPQPLREIKLEGFYPTHDEAMREAMTRAEAHARSEKETDEVRRILSHVPGLKIMSLGRWSRTILGWLCGATILLVVAVWIWEQIEN